jgi:hypothetical protein
MAKYIDNSGVIASNTSLLIDPHLRNDTTNADDPSLTPPPSITPSTTISTSKKRRYVYNDYERRNICRYFEDNPQGGQAGVVRWFYEKTSVDINQSIVLRILSPSYSYTSSDNKVL